LARRAKARPSGRRRRPARSPLQAKALPPGELEAAVQRSLRAQLAAAGRALHEELTRAGDPAPAAAALQAAADAADAAGPGGGEAGGGGGGDVGGGGGGLAALLARGGGGGGGGGGAAAPLLGQAAAAELLRARLGYSLEVRPSGIPHDDAGARPLCDSSALMGGMQTDG
jgi:hypothetical protein